MTDKFFLHPDTLFKTVEKVLLEVGPHKFFSSPHKEVKKAREGFAAYFFSLILKEYTKRDWWFLQFDEGERQYPDFDLMSFSENPAELKMESVELTGVYPNFMSFEDVVRVVANKQTKYGNKPLNFSLLINVNHEKSEEWTQMLRGHLATHHPFLSVWTMHLLFKAGGREVKKVVGQRIRPLPGLRIEADTGNRDIYKKQQIPSYMEEKKYGNCTYVTFKEDFINQIRTQLKARQG